MEQQQLIEADVVIAFQEVVIQDIVKRFTEHQAENFLPNEVVIAAYITKSYRSVHNPEFSSGEQVLSIVDSMIDRDESLDEDTKISIKRAVKAVYRVKQQ